MKISVFLLCIAIFAVGLGQDAPSGCKGCAGSGCLCENAVSPHVGWGLHFADLFKNMHYKIVNASAVWVVNGAWDNRGSNATQHQSVTTTVGYSGSKSTSITDTWSVSLGFSLGKIGGSASFSRAITHYSEQSFSVGKSKTNSIDIPPNSVVTQYQRLVTAYLQLQGTDGVKVDGNEAWRKVDVHLDKKQLWFSNPYGGPECECKDNHLGHITLTFTVDCYSTNPNKKQRDQFCPF